MRYSVNSRPSYSMWWIIFSFPGDTWLIVSVYRKIRRSHIIVMLDIRHFSVLPVTSKFARHTMLNTLMILQPFEVEKEREWIKFQSSSPHSVTNNLYNLGFSDCAIKWWAWLIYYLNFQAYWKDSHKSTCDKHKMQGGVIINNYAIRMKEPAVVIRLLSRMEIQNMIGNILQCAPFIHSAPSVGFQFRKGTTIQL